MRPATLMLLSGAIAAPAAARPATSGTITIAIPRVSVAEYHRPYVAVWIEGASGARTLAIWYDVKKVGKDPGTKWLSELRAWWRKGGRSLNMPVDGVSGATRAPGQYSISLPANLKPGSYVLNVEAARETGGRELVTLPLTIPGAASRAVGKAELGAVTLSAR